MARGVNKVILVGNLGNDPDTRSLPNGGTVASISIATSESWKDKNTGEQQERTEWHRIVFFNRLAEVVAQYLKKGSSVYIEGQLVTRKWEKDGQTHYTTEVKASEMQMLGGRGVQQDDSGHQGQNQGQDDGSPESQQGNPPKDDFNDTIPF